MMTQNTAIILVDPLNEFLHPTGKIFPRVSKSLESTSTVQNILKLVQAARASRIPIYYALHQQYHDCHYDGWQRMNPSLLRVKSGRLFEEGSFGAKIFSGMEPDPKNGDVIVSRHWNSSGFANTDLDYQLRQRDITHLILAGMVANTCLESTARYARELGYHVTLLTDATAGYTVEAKECATQLIWPLIADEVCTVLEWVSKSSQT
ncbi:Isochorismatase-like protein [Xylogone sp. PMI_703]|nr:Isochorismatase-like protein [Xylogone sp. PMI_703]